MSTGYVPQAWADDVTDVDAAHMSHIEAGIAAVDAALPAAARLVPTPVVNGQWLKGVGGAAVWSPIKAADVPGAARVMGRVGPTGAIIYSTAGVTCARTATGTYTITVPGALGFSQPVPIVSTESGVVYATMSVVSGTSFGVLCVTPSTQTDSYFNFAIFEMVGFSLLRPIDDEGPEPTPPAELPW